MGHKIVIWPDRALERVALPISVGDIEALAGDGPSKLRALLDELATVMLLANGGGLAAPQIGEARRVICLKVKKSGKPGEPEVPEVVHIINPSISLLSTETAEAPEGCLSVPGVSIPVRRAVFCRVAGFGYDGRPLEVGGEGLLAAALQHEIDHLDGKLIVEHLSVLRRDVLRRRLSRQKKHGLHYNFPTPEMVQ
jgi:peptide deformylase